jgi:hypothetical protein
MEGGAQAHGLGHHDGLQPRRSVRQVFHREGANLTKAAKLSIKTGKMWRNLVVLRRKSEALWGTVSRGLQLRTNLDPQKTPRVSESSLKAVGGGVGVRGGGRGKGECLLVEQG